MRILIILLAFLNIFCFGDTESVRTNKLIVFDFGGVIGATDKAAVAQAVSILLNLPVEELERMSQELTAAKETGRSRSQIWAEFERRTGTILPDNWDEYFEIIKMIAIRPNVRMIHLVTKLKAQGWRVAMLSNVSEQRAQYIRKLGIYRYFDPVVLSCEIDVKKPDPKAFQIFLSQAKTSPQECVYVDNNEKNLEVASTFGFDTIHFTTVEQLAKDLAKRGILDLSNWSVDKT